MVVTPEGFPLSYEVFSGNRRDVTTLEEMLHAIEKKYGSESRIWVCDRGLVSEKNLEIFEQRGCHYLVGTPRSELSKFETELLGHSWTQVQNDVEIQQVEDEGKKYVLARSRQRAEKERAMRASQIRGLMRDLIKLARRVR